MQMKVHTNLEDLEQIIQMCVCVYMYSSEGICEHVCVCVTVSECVHESTYIYICMLVCTSVCVHTPVHKSSVFTHAYMHVCNDNYAKTIPQTSVAYL